jgi:hypothetical protein
MRTVQEAPLLGATGPHSWSHLMGQRCWEPRVLVDIGFQSAHACTESSWQVSGRGLAARVTAYAVRWLMAAPLTNCATARRPAVCASAAHLAGFCPAPRAENIAHGEALPPRFPILAAAHAAVKIHEAIMAISDVHGKQRRCVERAGHAFELGTQPQAPASHAGAPDGAAPRLTSA